MSNVALFGGNGAISLGNNAKDMANALKNSAAQGSRGLPDGGVYISFSGKLGKYSIGEKKDDADPNEIWLVNIFGISAGYICWKGGSPVAKRMASIYGAPLNTPDMGEHGPFDSSRGEGWFPAKSLVLRSIDRGIQGEFTTNTKSAVSEFSRIEGEIADRLSQGLPAWPLICLQKETFTAQGQRNYKPVLAVYGWLADEQIKKMAEAESIDDIADAIDDLIDEATTKTPVLVAPADEDEAEAEVDPEQEKAEKVRRQHREEQAEDKREMRRRQPAEENKEPGMRRRRAAV